MQTANHKEIILKLNNFNYNLEIFWKILRMLITRQNHLANSTDYSRWASHWSVWGELYNHMACSSLIWF